MCEALCSKYIINSYDWIKKELVESDSIVKKHILARLGYVGLIPVHIICAAIDTIIGLGALLVSIFHSDAIEFSAHQLDQFAKIISYAHLNLLNFLNPEISTLKNSKLDKEYSPNRDSAYGIITFKLTKPIYKYEEALADSDNCLVNYVGSPLFGALRIVLFVATRSIDLLIGLSLIPFSLLIAATNIKCLNEKCIKLHRSAFRGVQIGAIAMDFVFFIYLIKEKTCKQTPHPEIEVEQNHDN